MSDNPYAPPTAELVGDSATGALTGSGDFDLGRCLSEAWESTWANFPLWLGAGLVWSLATGLAAASVVGLLLVPVLSWGMIRFFLRMHDREAQFGDVFSGFSRFGEVFGPVLVLSVIFFALSLVAQSVQYLGVWLDSGFVTALGYLVSLAFQLLVAPRLTFAFLYLVDRDLSGTEALSRAWADTDPVKWKVVLLGLLVYPLALAGLLALVVGIVPAMVMFYLMYVSAYRQMAGRRATA